MARRRLRDEITDRNDCHQVSGSVGLPQALGQ
jgi:hypothetical protein